MDRRRFIGGVAGSALLTGAEARAGEAPAARGRMKAGHQHDHSAETLKMLAAFGVSHICSGQIGKDPEGWSVDNLTRLRRMVESHGIKLECVPLPMSSRFITSAEHPNIVLGKDPERNAEIENIRLMIANAGKAGIPMVKYNFTILGVVRTARTPGRGGSSLSTFDYEKAVAENPGLTPAGKVTDEEMWGRLRYFLDRVMPVADEHKVRLACHPHDPGMPKDKGFRGVPTILGSVDGLKRFIELSPSPYHGLNFCQGTVSEMLEKPGEQIYDVIRHFARRKKIFQVHFRNIKGGFLKFQETFPDDGDVDMLRALRAYREAGYDGMVMPDHVPQIGVTEGSAKAFAFAFGYIRAAIQAVYEG
jgi:mannonate dehydratase